MFGKLKDWRRIHTRYDRCADTFMSAFCIAATVIFWLNQRVLTLISRFGRTRPLGACAIALCPASLLLLSLQNQFAVHPPPRNLRIRRHLIRTALVDRWGFLGTVVA
jgi:hypothetical protein